MSLRDPRTFKMEHEFDAFSGSLSDFDVHGNLLAACGFSSRGLNGLSCDRFLMVYDLRMMRAITPLQVHVDPLFLRFIPTYTSRLAIISQTGMKVCEFVCVRVSKRLVGPQGYSLTSYCMASDTSIFLK